MKFLQLQWIHLQCECRVWKKKKISTIIAGKIILLALWWHAPQCSFLRSFHWLDGWFLKMNSFQNDCLKFKQLSEIFIWIIQINTHQPRPFDYQSPLHACESHDASCYQCYKRVGGTSCIDVFLLYFYVLPECADFYWSFRWTSFRRTDKCKPAINIK